MFTLKLYRGHTVRILEVESVQIFAAGPAAKMADEVEKRTNDVREIACVAPGAPNGYAFYVTKDPKKLGTRFMSAERWKLESANFYDYAYLENSSGATTARIYAY